MATAYQNEPITLHCPSVASIQRAVAKTYGIPLLEMFSARRGWEVSHPRQVAMYLSKQLTPLSFPNIGKHFGDRDHTTVMHAVAAVEKRIANSRNTELLIGSLMDELTNG